MKYKYLISLGLLIVTMGLMSTGNGNVVSNDKNIIYDKNDIRIECSEDGVKVYNSTDYDIYNVTVESKDKNSAQFSTKTYIGTVEGKSIVDKKLSSLKGMGYLNRIGGYSSVLIGLMVVLLVFEGISLYLDTNNTGEFNLPGSVAYAITALCLVLCLSIVYRGTIDTKAKNYVRVDSGNYTVSFIDNIIEVKEEKVKEDIPFDTKYVLDDDKYANESAVILPGENGSKLVTYDVTYVNGEVVSKESIHEKTLKEPETRTVSQGTKTISVSEKIPPVKLYKPDSSMNYGDYKQEKSSLEQGKTLDGEKEVTYKWDSQNQKLEITEIETRKPGVEIWKAGTLLVEEKILNCKNKYILDEKHEVGYMDVVEDFFDGNKKATYEVVIDELTGREKSGSKRKKLSEEIIEPINGVVKLGVLSKDKRFKVKYTTKEEENPTKYTTYRKVKHRGIDKEVICNCIMGIDESTGEITDEVVKRLDEKVIVEGQEEVVEVGTKEPNWVKTVVLEDTIPYETKYVVNTSLKGDETKVKTKGKNGRVYSEYAMPCDDNGNLLLDEGYTEKVITEGAVEDPVAEVIEVSNESGLVKSKK